MKMMGSKGVLKLCFTAEAQSQLHLQLVRDIQGTLWEWFEKPEDFAAAELLGLSQGAGKYTVEERKKDCTTIFIGSTKPEPKTNAGFTSVVYGVNSGLLRPLNPLPLAMVMVSVLL